MSGVSTLAGAGRSSRRICVRSSQSWYGRCAAKSRFSSSSETMWPCSMSTSSILPGCRRHFFTIFACGMSSTPISEDITIRSSSVMK